MKVSNQFKVVIQNHLNQLAEKDELFAKTLAKPKKNIDDCIKYILNQVKASGINGFADEEIFNMATHYYDEDDIKVGSKINATVVVNHSVELSEKDLETAKKQAYEMAVEKEKKKLTSKPKASKKPEVQESSQISLF